MAQTYAKNLFDQYLQQLRGPAGGTGSRASNPGGDLSSLLGQQDPTGSGALGFGFNTLGHAGGTRTGSASGGPIQTSDLYYMGLGDEPQATSYSPPSDQLPASAQDDYSYYA